jgi:hypothetical protein
MPIPFIDEENITWNDIERCPFPFSHPDWREWNEKDDKRLLLIALDRYADKIIALKRISNSFNSFIHYLP